MRFLHQFLLIDGLTNVHNFSGEQITGTPAVSGINDYKIRKVKSKQSLQPAQKDWQVKAMPVATHIKQTQKSDSP